MAVLLDLVLRRRWRDALAVAAVAGLLVSPWLAWMAAVGPGARTQADLLLQGDDTWPGRIAGQLVFYVRRIPDQITGPFVEVGTAFQHSTKVARRRESLGDRGDGHRRPRVDSHPPPAATTPGGAGRALHAAASCSSGRSPRPAGS